MENITEIEAYLIENKLGSDSKEFTNMMTLTKISLNNERAPTLREYDAEIVKDKVFSLIDKGYGIQGSFTYLGVVKDTYFSANPKLAEEIRNYKKNHSCYNPTTRKFKY